MVGRLALAAGVALFGSVDLAGEGRAALPDGLPIGRSARPVASPPRVVPGPRGQLSLVPGRSPLFGRGRVIRFGVEVEGGLRLDRQAFAAEVEQILGDRRGWRGGRRLAFRRVASGRIDLRVALASPATTDRLCAPIPTNGIFSCASGNRAVLNLRRWRTGSFPYRGDLTRYRIYMVNHEVGHVLGHSHHACPSGGARAPVMMQQTKGLGSCTANPWPLPSERG